METLYAVLSDGYHAVFSSPSLEECARNLTDAHDYVVAVENGRRRPLNADEDARYATALLSEAV